MRQGEPGTRGIFWVLRVGTAMDFIGHGVLGISRVALWTSYFAVVGIHRDTALALMPLVGAFDVALGLLALFRPVAGAMLYCAAWSLWTALLRPLAGEPAWEAIERAGNCGAPLALALLVRAGSPRSWLGFRPADPMGGGLRRRLHWVLRLTTALLLLGHGLLGLAVSKPALAAQYARIGLAGTWVEPAVGCLECALALAVLVRPGAGLLLFVFGWKLATELLSPISGAPLWVFIEHGGSYAAPLALALLMRERRPAAERRPPEPGASFGDQPVADS
jgi:hypothetical protein